MYKKPVFKNTSIYRKTKEVGQTIETKIKRLVENNEVLDEKPLIYTEKKEGVQAGHNIRTDKWEIAVETMDKLHKYRNAQGESKRGKIVELNQENREQNGTENNSDA